MVTIVDPHIKRESGYPVHTLAQAADLYVKTKDGHEYEVSVSVREKHTPSSYC